MISFKHYRRHLLLVLFTFSFLYSFSQCGGIMEPGFAFLTSSRGCAPFTVNIQTLYLSSVPGTQYFVDWGDGTPEETYTQVGPTGVNISHNYPLASINCGYDVVIDASNACNPRGSVVPINTQVIVWTNDVIAINPATYRVCQGFAASVSFTDDSDWNCFPRATRENAEPRWIQWIYGTGSLASQILNVQVNGITPGAFPYRNPAPGTNPIYPVTSPGQLSLPISVPVTTVADIGKEFEVTLKNWNQCNAYDNNLLDLNAFNPVGGDLINGDNAPQVTTARIVIVPSPQPTFDTRLGTATGPIQSLFCIGDNIYFDNNTPNIAGASFRYTWQFYGDNTGAGAPISTSTATNPTYAYASSGQKLIRLSVRDQNAAGNCIAIFEKVITISPSLVAKIAVTDFANVPITPNFCQQGAAPYTTFQVRVKDASIGTAIASSEWKWEFYDQNNVLIRQEPASGYSATPLGPFDLTFVTRGIYRVRLITRDNLTSCETSDEVQIKVFEKPLPQFSATTVCEGLLTSFSENSTLQPLSGETIVLREWDFNYNGVSFNKDPAFDNKTSFTRSMGVAGTYQVALRVTTNQNACADMLVKTVRVLPLPAASFTPDVISGCSILTVNFANNSVLGQPATIDRYEWQADEKEGLGFQIIGTQRPTDPGFSPNFTYQFKNTGNANKVVDVRLRVVSTNLCERISSTASITIFPGTKSGFSSTNYSPFNNNCTPLSVNFAVDSQTKSLNPANYRWQIRDASGIVSDVSTGTTSTYSYLFTNNTQVLKDYSVKLITTLPSGCFGDSTRTIRVSPVPSSAFKIDTLSFECKFMKVRLTATQKGLTVYHWVIAENGIVVVNTTGSVDQIEHTFNRPASDIAAKFSLDTKNFANCSSTITEKNIIVPKLDDIGASFLASPAVQTLPSATVTITNNTKPGPWIYLWDFGDGTTSTSSTISSHTYSTYGKFTINLKVSSASCFETQTQTIEILAIPPIVDFSYAPAAGCAPLQVKFTNLSKYAEPDKYFWEFGSGQATSTAIDPTYTYYEPGKYTVSLSATNATGKIVKVTKPNIIEVYAIPKADFDVKPRLITIPGGIMYTRNLSFGASRFLWEFGDESTSTDFEPEHSYKEEGNYTIRLTAYNQFDCANTAVKENLIRTEKGGQVLVPNAFSPGGGGSGSGVGGSGGGDGKNDIFLPITRGVVEFELLVFNRWGELLFQSTNPEIGWDGTYNGKLCQQDVYVYRLTTAYENGQRLVRVGDINLIR